MNNSETDTESEEYNNMNSINDLSTDSEDNNSTIQNTINGGENDIEIMKKLVNMCVKYENDLIKINEVKKTLTDKLSAEEIKEKLEDYIEVEDISKVPLNTHIRYFTEKINEKGKKTKAFRMGGFLVNKNNYDKQTS